MARPPKDPAEQLTYRGNFRLTDAEGRQIEEDAANAGTTVSDYMRGLALKTKPRRRKATPDRAALIQLLGQLGLVRAAINQLVKDRNARQFVDPEQVYQTLTAIKDTANKIHDVLEQ